MTFGQQGEIPSDRSLEDIIIGLVTSTLDKKPGSVGPEDALFSSRAGFDSFSLMELVLRLEDTFDLSIPDEDLDPDVFQSVRSIARYVKAQLAKRVNDTSPDCQSLEH